jgi:O-antigen/teichoic acid export membrane protein
VCPSQNVVAAPVDGLSIRASLRRALMFGSGRVAGQVLNIGLLPLILRFVSPAEFGAFTFLQTIALIWGVVMSLGISTTFVSRFSRLAQEAENVPRLLGACLAQQFLFGGVLLAVGLALLPAVSPRLASDAPPLALALLFAAEFVANHVLIIARWQMLTGRQGQVSAVASVRSATFVAVALPCVSVAGLGVVGLALADFASDVAAALICAVSTRGQIKLQVQRVDLWATVRLGLPAMPDTILFWLTVSAPLYALRRNGLTASAGEFGLAWRLASAIDLLGNSLAIGSTGELLRSRATDLAQRMFQNTMFLVALASLALSAVAPEVIHWFFQASMMSAVPAIPLATLGSFFLSAYYFEWVGLSGSHRTIGLSLATAAGTVTAALTFLLVPVSSATVAAAFYALSMLAMWIAARRLGPDAKLGNAIEILGGGLAITALGLMLQRIPISPVGFACKVAICGGLAALFVLRARRTRS